MRSGRRAGARHHEPADARPLQRAARRSICIASVRAGAARCSPSAKGCCRRRRYTRAGRHLGRPRARATGRTRAAANQLGLMKFALTQAGVSGPRRSPSRSRASTSATTIRDGGARAARVFAHLGRVRRVARAPTASCGRARRASRSASTSRPTTPATPSCSTRVIAEIERQGGEAIPLFGYPGAVAVERLLLDRAGKCARRRRPRRSSSTSPVPRRPPILAKVDIPVINLISLYGRSETGVARLADAGCRSSKAPSRWRCPSWPARWRPTVVGSQEKIHDRRDRPDRRRPQADRVAGGDGGAARRCNYAALRATPNARQARRARLLQLSGRARRTSAPAISTSPSRSRNILQRLKRGRLRRRRRRPVGEQRARGRCSPRRATSAAMRRASSTR